MLSHGSQSPIEPVGILVDTAAETGATKRSQLQIPAVVFGIGIATLVLYLFTFAINIHNENDFYREAWPPYQQLFHGHFNAFLRSGPAYIGSLLMRAPFALLAHAFGADARATYFVSALPCLLAPPLLSGYVAAQRLSPTITTGETKRTGLRPVDLYLLIPSAAFTLNGGHPEDVLGAALCVYAVLLAHRGAGSAAAFALAVAVINKSWAVVVVPLVFAVMPTDKRPRSLITFLVIAGLVLIPITAVRASSAGSAGNALGGQSVGIFLVPQLLFWFGRGSWVAREGHVLLVVVTWLVTGLWWWLRLRGNRRPARLQDVFAMLALVFFLRAALDPWDNIYYFAPFMLAIAVYEDPPGFPKLTWLFAIGLVLVVPPWGVFKSLGHDSRAGVFTGFALLTILWFGWRAFRADRTPRDVASQAAT
jgi:hypothetical protein